MFLLEFECSGFRFALPLDYMHRVIPSAELTPLPGAPDIVLGILNYRGEVAVVINFFKRVGLTLSDIKISHQILLIKIGDNYVGLLIDQVIGVVTREIEAGSDIPEQLSGADFVQTVQRLDDGLILICDPPKFLLDDEKALIRQALERSHHAER